ncbi:MAG: HU family DNA-binding protein [Fusobacteriaceae bacterium]
MTKKEFIELYLKKTGMKTKAEAERAVEGFLETIQEILVEGNDVSFVGFGKFEAVERAAKLGRNPKTGVEIQIPAKKAVKFKAGKALSDAVAAK